MRWNWRLLGRTALIFIGLYVIGQFYRLFFRGYLTGGKETGSGFCTRCGAPRIDAAGRFCAKCGVLYGG
jgi:hypothetical protein